MNHTFPRSLVFAVTLTALLAGCRREDIRTFTVEIPGLNEGNKAQVVECLNKFAGIRHDSYVWDMKAKTLTMRYDSMQLAETNVRMAIADKGIKVTFPEKTDNHAGH